MDGAARLGPGKIILFLTHFWDAACAGQLQLLRLALPEYDFAVAGFLDQPEATAIPADVPVHLYSREALNTLPYPNIAKLRPHHLILPRFFQSHPDYRQYWMIEYDVRYTGDWGELLRDLEHSPADLLSTVIQRRAENPAWPLWHSLDTGATELAEAHRVKIFMPFTRLSNAAIRAADAVLRAGWSGHYEVLWPSAAAASGLLIEDIGGKGSFTPPSRHGRHYTTSPLDPFLSPGSFVFRPSILETDIPPAPARLWHPVKSVAMSAPLPPPPPPTWRDMPLLRLALKLNRRLRHGRIARQG